MVESRYQDYFKSGIAFEKKLASKCREAFEVLDSAPKKEYSCPMQGSNPQCWITSSALYPLRHTDGRYFEVSLSKYLSCEYESLNCPLQVLASFYSKQILVLKFPWYLLSAKKSTPKSQIQGPPYCSKDHFKIGS